jgi:hypothetical protein
MVKLRELDLKTVVPDGDDTIDCHDCKYPVGTFEDVYIKNDGITYKICPVCGEIYKVKD